MVSPADEKRWRRHDESFQKATLDGLDRIRAVLHDISDAVRELTDTVIASTEATRREQVGTVVERSEGEKLLMTVGDVAEMTGLSKSTIYQLRYSQDGPVPTKIGGRLFFHRDDLHRWLADQRQIDLEPSTRPWRRGFLGGGIGARHPRSSEPPTRVWCNGSHTEPMAASTYSGRAVCRECRDDVLVNADGRLRKHYPRWW